LRITWMNIGIIVIIIIAVALAGCATQTTPTTTGGAGQAKATGTVSTGSSGAPSGGSAPQPGSVVTGTGIFGTIPSYTWIEYKTVMNTGGKLMTTYLKIEKSGKCTMRMEGEGLPSGGMTIDCSPKGGQAQAQSDPNDVKPDVKFIFAGIEPVSVPAGTYAAASKYTVTTQGLTSTYWTASGVPGFVKFQVNTEGGPVTTELNGWG
jgi:hypothetical protein